VRKLESDDQELYRSYRLMTEAEHIGPALRNAVLIFILLQTIVFIPADWVIFPDKFLFFFAARMILNVVLCAIYFLSANRFPIASSIAVGAVGAALFLMMVYQTGGTNSGYYVGFILLTIGLGVLVPLSGKQALGIGAMIFGFYALLPIYGKEQVNWSALFQHLFFLGAACVEAAWAAAYMDRMRFLNGNSNQLGMSWRS
jgi:hypothetical protein